MKTTRILFAITALVLCASIVGAQSRNVGLNIDIVSYLRDSGVVKLEVYYSFLQRDIQMKEIEKNRWEGVVNASVAVIENGVETQQKNISKTLSLQGTKQELTTQGLQTVNDVVTLYIKNGKSSLLRFAITLADSTGKLYGDTIEKRFTVPTKDESNYVFSGIFMASEIVKTDKDESPFEKSGYYFTPNPSLTFGNAYKTLNYYTELYIPDSHVRLSDSITMTTTINDLNQAVLLKSEVRIPLSTATLSYIGSISIDGLPMDSYYLTLSASNGKGVSNKTQKVFYVESDMIISEEETATDVASLSEDVLFQMSDISKMSEGELNDKIAQASYVLPDDLRKTLVELKDLPSKQLLFYTYWRKQDFGNVRPLTEYNEYFKRVEYANKKFNYQRTLGWKTDRGRIYITYGPPTDIESELFSTQAKPYIQWEYQGMTNRFASGSRVYFYFVDRMGGGNFNLVHSNVHGEVSDPNWYQNTALQIR